MKTLRANGSRLKSDAGRPKKWIVSNPETVVYQYERFGVGTKKEYEQAKEQVNTENK